MGIGKIFSHLRIFVCLPLILLAGCASTIETYRDPNMDFGAVRTVAVMPFVNLSRDQLAGDRVRDVFVNALLATGAVYVLPTGEVARGVIRTELQNRPRPPRRTLLNWAKPLRLKLLSPGP